MKYIYIFTLALLVACSSRDQKKNNPEETLMNVDSLKSTSSDDNTKIKAQKALIFDTVFMVYPIAFEIVKSKEEFRATTDSLNMSKLSYDASYIKISSDHEGACEIRDKLNLIYFGESYDDLFEHGVDYKTGQELEEYQAVIQNTPIEELEQDMNWEYSLLSKIIYNKNNLLTIQIEEYQYRGGAHGNSSLSFLTFDTKTGRKLELKDLIKNKEYLLNEIDEKLKEYQKVNDGSPKLWEENVDLIPEHYFFDDSIFYVRYAPYEIASYVYGTTQLEIPMYYTELFNIFKNDDVFSKILPPTKLKNITSEQEFLLYKLKCDFSAFEPLFSFENYDNSDSTSSPLDAKQFVSWFKMADFKDSTCQVPMEPGRFFGGNDCIMYDPRNNIVFDDSYNYFIDTFPQFFNTEENCRITKDDVIELFGKPYKKETNIIGYQLKHTKEIIDESFALVFLFSEGNQLIGVRYAPKESFYQVNGIQE